MTAGAFISFEGGEGSGKSTQIKRMAERLMAVGIDVLHTREPGGSAGAELVRTLLVDGDAERWSAMAEALLIYAARDDHLQHVIRPALSRGKWVLCDRFMDSTRAYQGYSGGVAHGFLDQLEQQVVGDTVPDLTLIFDLDPEIGLARAAKRAQDAMNAEDRFERKGLAFHQTLRDGFLAIAAQASQRCRVIDAAQTPDKVTDDIWQVLKSMIDDERIRQAT